MAATAVLLAVSPALAGYQSSTPGAAGSNGVMPVVAAENEYGNVAAQIGGQYVKVSSVESNPNTDPHTYEVSAGVASEVAGASLAIQNGVGYDSFMNKVESAAPNSKRKVINVQHLLGLPDSTPNPHLWYDPKTMPAVAEAIGDNLAALEPAHAAYFHANVNQFDTSLQPWVNVIRTFRATYPGTTAATTEPVADYLLQAMGIDNLTPFAFQADIMNGNDPSPQDVDLENSLFAKHQVKVFCYNQQVTDTLTQSIRGTARRAGIPVVGVYETMPTPGYTYQ
jgi:zinc/manganese transport system substrate-binding protein